MSTAIDVSLVLTTRNRADKLAATLDTLAAQQTSGFEWEVIVVDNGSTDDTPRILEQSAAHIPLVALRYDRPGKCRAQNYALGHVKGRLVVFTDDDVSPEVDWLACLWRAAERWPEADIFGGAIRVSRIGATPEWLAGAPGESIIDRHCAHYWPRDDEGYTDVPPIGPNMTIRRAALTGVWFDENVGPDGSADYIKGGDTDLNQALMAQGHRCVFVPTAVVHHHAYAEQLELDELVRGAYRRGRKNAYLAPQRDGMCVFGAPLKLWFKLVKQGLRYRLSIFRAPIKQYEVGVKYHYRRGYLRQLRESNAVHENGR